MNRIFRLTLTERLTGIPAGVVEVSVAIATATCAVGLRYILIPFAGHAAPYAPISLGVMISAIVAGWRSALLSLIFGVWAALYFIAQPLPGNAVEPVFGPAAIFLFSQMCVIMIINTYHEEAREQADRAQTAYKEIEHRTKNNYQIILSMVHLQAKRSTGIVAEAFKLFATRIMALSMVTESLRGHQLDTLTLGEHLCNLMSHLEESLAPADVEIVCDVENIPIHLQSATPISLVVNELITNAIKHAFPDDDGGIITVTGKQSDEVFNIIIKDDGVGMDPNKPSNGLGKKLIASFVRQLNATLSVESSSKGTCYYLTIPMASMHKRSGKVARNHE